MSYRIQTRMSIRKKYSEFNTEQVNEENFIQSPNKTYCKSINDLSDTDSSSNEGAEFYSVQYHDSVNFNELKSPLVTKKVSRKRSIGIKPITPSSRSSIKLYDSNQDPQNQESLTVKKKNRISSPLIRNTIKDSKSSDIPKFDFRSTHKRRTTFNFETKLQKIFNPEARALNQPLILSNETEFDSNDVVNQSTHSNDSINDRVSLSPNITKRKKIRTGTGNLQNNEKSSHKAHSNSVKKDLGPLSANQKNSIHKTIKDKGLKKFPQKNDKVINKISSMKNKSQNKPNNKKELLHESNFSKASKLDENESIEICGKIHRSTQTNYSVTSDKAVQMNEKYLKAEPIRPYSSRSKFKNLSENYNSLNKIGLALTKKTPTEIEKDEPKRPTRSTRIKK